MDRIKILDQLRGGDIDVLIGVNLLREGLDLPEVSLVAVIDADKEGFLRDHRSLTQTAGRAARNLNGLVIMYADKITDSMKKTINETDRRRSLQLKYNEENGITPQAIIKARNLIVGQDTNDIPKVTSKGRFVEKSNINPVIQSYIEKEFNKSAGIAADPVVKFMSVADKKKAIERLRIQMTEAAKRMDFIEAAQYRDELLALEKSINNENKND